MALLDGRRRDEMIEKYVSDCDMVDAVLKTLDKVRGALIADRQTMIDSELFDIDELAEVTATLGALKQKITDFVDAM